MSYEPPSREWSKIQLRELFLLRVNDFAPQVLIELGGGPFSLFLEAGMHGPTPMPWSGMEGLRLYNWMAGELLKEESRIWNRLYHSRQAETFCHSLLKWAASYNISADWILVRAMLTLYKWHQKGRQPGFGGERGWLYMGAGGPVPTPLPPPAGLAAYGWMWSRANYLESVERIIRERFEEVLGQYPELSYGNPSFLNAYIQSVKEDTSLPAKYADRSDKHIKSHGWVENKHHRNLERDLRWAVQFQVLSMELEKIAADTPQPKDPNKTFSVSTVSRAVIGYTPKGKPHVPGLLEKIGLTRRPDSGPGRRRGCKESAESWRRSIKRAQLPA